MVTLAIFLSNWNKYYHLGLNYQTTNKLVTNFKGTLNKCKLIISILFVLWDIFLPLWWGKYSNCQEEPSDCHEGLHLSWALKMAPWLTVFLNNSFLHPHTFPVEKLSHWQNAWISGVVVFLLWMLICSQKVTRVQFTTEQVKRGKRSMATLLCKNTTEVGYYSPRVFPGIYALNNELEAALQLHRSKHTSLWNRWNIHL